MLSIESSVTAFSKEEIYQQVQRIMADRIFSVSEILQRFLLFVAQETLEGRSNQIKEYTIGLNVLQKPFDFNPKQDAIVRIHACRLRRALYKYYTVSGVNDAIFISIPKGSYCPVFSDNTVERPNEVRYEQESIGGCSVGDPGKYVVRADIQYCKDRIKIIVHMMNTETQQEVWNQVMEYKLCNLAGLDIQGDIARKLIAIVGEYYQFIKLHLVVPPKVALA